MHHQVSKHILVWPSGSPGAATWLCVDLSEYVLVTLQCLYDYVYIYTHVGLVADCSIADIYMLERVNMYIYKYTEKYMLTSVRDEA